ncbi:glycosyltransferase [Kordiimonas lipolytica]|uniref:Glycosyltransferase n=1 Tax=Kordiimonas lipolytica TaxID=1662421 RepID=A0ABV8UGP9_9PROT|nr:glycosyltransferase [Kordiimonas lipolytica]
MQSTQTLLNKLQQMESAANGDIAYIHDLENLYEQLAGQGLELSQDFLRARNIFRVKNAHLMQQPRPKILLGLINSEHFPNFHTVPLMRVADVVSITTTVPKSNEVDRLHLTIGNTSLSDAIDRLPSGFGPDLYWDPQICGASVLPIGLEKLPFPTVGGLCHQHLTLSIENFSHFYDFLCPLSARYVELVGNAFPDKIILDLPFGGNWGSFKDIIPPLDDTERDIDLLLSFSNSSEGAYGAFRKKTHTLFEAFKKKYGSRYNLVAISGLTRTEYIQHLRRSKIALNSVGQHGPYNYRTCEIMNAGAAMMQYDAVFPIGDLKLDQYFRDGTEAVLFDEGNFEHKLLDLLENPEKAKAIAQAGQHRMNTEYSYESIYRMLIQQVQDKAASTKPRTLTREQAVNHRIAGLFHAPQSHKKPYALYHAMLHSLQTQTSMEHALLAQFDLLRADIFTPLLMKIVRDDALTTMIQQQTLSGLDGLYQRIAEPTIVDRWNVVMHRLRLGVCDNDMLAQIRDDLKGSDQAEHLLNATSLIYIPKVPQLDTEAAAKAELNHLSTQYLLAGNDASQKDKILKAYMCEIADLALAYTGQRPKPIEGLRLA